MTEKTENPTATNSSANTTASKAMNATRYAIATTSVFVATMSMAHAEDVAIDFSPGLTGVAIIAGLIAAGQSKALPTYAAWGVRKVLSMFR